LRDYCETIDVQAAMGWEAGRSGTR